MEKINDDVLSTLNFKLVPRNKNCVYRAVLFILFMIIKIFNFKIFYLTLLH